MNRENDCHPRSESKREQNHRGGLEDGQRSYQDGLQADGKIEKESEKMGRSQYCASLGVEIEDV